MSARCDECRKERGCTCGTTREEYVSSLDIPYEGVDDTEMKKMVAECRAYIDRMLMDLLEKKE